MEIMAGDSNIDLYFLQKRFINVERFELVGQFLVYAIVVVQFN